MPHPGEELTMRAVRAFALVALAAALHAGPARAATKEVVRVGTEGSYAPFTFLDEKGQLTGYDVEVMKDVARRAGLDARFVPTPWDSMFLGLESKKFDLVANQIAKNPEREKKYRFSDDYLVSGAQIIVKADRGGDFKSLSDLKGLRVGTGVGSNYAKMLEEHNAKNPSAAVKVQTYEGDVTVVLQDIAAGRLDATVNDRLTVGYAAQKQKLPLKAVGSPLALVPSHFVVRKDAQGEALVKKVNAALAEMKKDGTLAKLSQKWFGGDYTK
jgi:ABC-type amino acid transport substrate-binding protein